MEYRLTWKDNSVSHTERRFSPDHPVIPDIMRCQLKGAAPGDTSCLSFKPGTLVPPHDPTRIHDVPVTFFRKIEHGGYPVLPKQGRFYPCGFVRGLPEPGVGHTLPLRVLGVGKNSLTLDLNHPLGRHALAIEIIPHGKREHERITYRTAIDWAEEITSDGPGMQAPLPGLETDFSEISAFLRTDPGPDAEFYQRPRLVGHVDSAASGWIRDIYANRLHTGYHVLDLMSSFQSHLPGHMDLEVTGLGMNMDEMESNPLICRAHVHDLNEDPTLPFSDCTFDSVVSSLSVEYLTEPLRVFEETARIVKPGGSFLIGFSNRWFPPKAVRLWTLLHPFERMGWTLQLLGKTGKFSGLFTETVRGWPRPVNDRLFPSLSTSDPVFVVGGTRM